jgi:hypothetical protein
MAWYVLVVAGPGAALDWVAEAGATTLLAAVHLAIWVDP